MPELTAAARFARCLDHVLLYEGGYADHPRDPGGATNMGITRKTLARWRRVSPWWKLPRAEVKALGRTEAARIYDAAYWQRVHRASFERVCERLGRDFSLSAPVVCETFAVVYRGSGEQVV